MRKREVVEGDFEGRRKGRLGYYSRAGGRAIVLVLLAGAVTAAVAGRA